MSRPLRHGPPGAAVGGADRAALEAALAPRVGAWLLTGALAGFAAVTAAVAVGLPVVLSVDETVAAWGYHLTAAHPWLHEVWLFVDVVSEPIILRVLLVVIGLYLAYRGRWLLAGWLVGTSVAEQLVAPWSKTLLDRARPHWAEPLAVEHSTSYPAGHAVGVAYFASAIVLLTLATTTSVVARRTVTSVAVLLTVVISLDRIFLGLHWLSDVVGGLLLGAAVTLAGLGLAQRLPPRRGRTP